MIAARKPALCQRSQIFGSQNSPAGLTSRSHRSPPASSLSLIVPRLLRSPGSASPDRQARCRGGEAITWRMLRQSRAKWCARHCARSQVCRPQPSYSQRNDGSQDSRLEQTRFEILVPG
jgi:hypothetical protein